MDRLSPPNIHVLKLIMSYTLNKYSCLLVSYTLGSWRHPVSRAVPHKAQLEARPQLPDRRSFGCSLCSHRTGCLGTACACVPAGSGPASWPTLVLWAPSTHFSPCSMSSLPNKMGICHEALKSENCFWGYSWEYLDQLASLFAPGVTWAPPSPSCGSQHGAEKKQGAVCSCVDTWWWVHRGLDEHMRTSDPEVDKLKLLTTPWEVYQNRTYMWL